MTDLSKLTVAELREMVFYSQAVAIESDGLEAFDELVRRLETAKQEGFDEAIGKARHKVTSNSRCPR